MENPIKPNSPINIENSKEKRIQTIEINGIPLEAEKYYFEYPKRIQQETGILGYERTIVKEEDILRITKERLESLGLDTTNCNDFDSLDKLRKDVFTSKKEEFGISSYSWGKEYEESKEKWWNYLKTEEGKIILRSCSPGSFNEELDLHFSNGEFPSRTFNHVMGAYVEKEQSTKPFIEDRLFLQKLFDVELSKKIKLGGNRSISTDENTSIFMDVYEKENGKPIDETDVSSLHKYSEKIKQDEVFLLGTDAFNLSIGRFWDEQSTKSLSVGFSCKDPFFQEYLKKAYKFFLDNDYENDLLGIQQVMMILVFGSDEFIAKFKELENNEDIKEEEKVMELNNLFLKIRDSFLPDIDQETILSNKKKESSCWKDRSGKNATKHLGRDHWFDSPNFQFDDHTLNRLQYAHDYGHGYSWGRQEVTIPIFINHNEMPQLSWGHAKYAHFMNKKGFNFFEFKHAEHLPQNKKI